MLCVLPDTYGSIELVCSTWKKGWLLSVFVFGGGGYMDKGGGGGGRTLTGPMVVYQWLANAKR